MHPKLFRAPMKCCIICNDVIIKYSVYCRFIKGLSKVYYRKVLLGEVSASSRRLVGPSGVNISSVRKWHFYLFAFFSIYHYQYQYMWIYPRCATDTYIFLPFFSIYVNISLIYVDISIYNMYPICQYILGAQLTWHIFIFLPFLPGELKPMP